MKRIGLMLLLAGCATSAAAQERTVASVDREVRVCVDGADLRGVAQLRFHRYVCAYVGPKNLVRQCHDESVAAAEVVRVVDSRCVVVAASDEASIRPGDGVEIASR